MFLIDFKPNKTNKKNLHIDTHICRYLLNLNINEEEAEQHQSQPQPQPKINQQSKKRRTNKIRRLSRSLAVKRSVFTSIPGPPLIEEEVERRNPLVHT